jgi:hypothetical protein
MNVTPLLVESQEQKTINLSFFSRFNSCALPSGFSSRRRPYWPRQPTDGSTATKTTSVWATATDVCWPKSSRSDGLLDEALHDLLGGSFGAIADELRAFGRAGGAEGDSADSESQDRFSDEEKSPPCFRRAGSADVDSKTASTQRAF